MENAWHKVFWKIVNKMCDGIAKEAELNAQNKTN